MKRVFLNMKLGENWSRTTETYARGSAFVKDGLLKGKALAEYFDQRKSENARIKALCKANGFFAAVHVSVNEVFAAVDRIRSIPLFYSVKNSKLFISDDPYWIKEQLGTVKPDEGARNELLLTRYITGRDTIYKEIKQLLPGEYLSVNTDEPLANQKMVSRYYTFEHAEKLNLPVEDLHKKHGEALDRAFGRFVEWAQGRPVIVPLSGGYDSRLVVLMLKRMKYENIHTFSFGKPDNPDAAVSRKAAENLGLPWLFVPYDPESMFSRTNSSEWREYNRMADGMCCTCFDRDWPAVWQLKKEGLIPEDGIFVPGHSGDFISGGHIREGFADRKTVSRNEFAKEVLDRHYTMWKWSGQKEILEPLLQKRILSCIDLKGDMAGESAVDMYEKWVWQEFQSKYLVNGVRVYEFWGFDWWLPLWDHEYMDFWSGMPLKFRLNRRLYNDYVFRLYSDMAGISLGEARIRNDSLSVLSQLAFNAINSVKRLIRNTPVRPLALNLLEKASYLKPSLPKAETMEFDWEQCQGRINRKLYEKLAPFMTNRSSCTTLEKLGYIKFTDEDLSEEVLAFLSKLKG